MKWKNTAGKKNIAILAKIKHDRNIAKLYSKGELFYDKIPGIPAVFESIKQQVFELNKEGGKMKEIVVISGKGGTGKTSITASFACLDINNIVVADCDVDAADLHLLLQPNILEQSDFYSGFIANIAPEKCTQCGICKNICRFDAIKETANNFYVDELDCEGCGYCEKVCPTQAIQMKSNNVGQLYVSTTKHKQNMVSCKAWNSCRELWQTGG